MEQFSIWLTTAFNNRELAIGLWLMVCVLFCLTRSDLRKAIWSVIRALLAPRLLLFFGIVAANVAILCWMFASLKLWSMDQVPATVLWFMIAGSVMAVRALDVKEDDGYFRGLLKGSLRLGGIFEFIVVAQSFGIVTELVLAPILFLLGAMLVMSEAKPEHAQVKTLLEFVLLAIVVVFLWNSISVIWGQPEQFFTTNTGRNFIFPILMTVGCIPVFYVLYCYSHVEQARIQINQKTFQSDELKQYACNRFFLIFLLRPWLLRRATRQFHVLPAKSNADVDQIINDILSYERSEGSPTEIDPSVGWSPFLARDFLKEHGLRTNDFHKGYDEYWASSNYVDLDDHVLPNNATFTIEGEEGVVKTLKLTGKFRDDFEGSSAMVKLREIAQALCLTAIGETDIDFETVLPDADVFETNASIGGTIMKTWANRYPSETGYEVFISLSR